MQKKESKTNIHFIFSLIKSLVRISGCVFLFFDSTIEYSIYYFAGSFIIAEILGIGEEIF